MIAKSPPLPHDNSQFSSSSLSLIDIERLSGAEDMEPFTSVSERLLSAKNQTIDLRGSLVALRRQRAMNEENRRILDKNARKLDEDIAQLEKAVQIEPQQS